jgi:hypothetical protein
LYHYLSLLKKVEKSGAFLTIEKYHFSMSAKFNFA